MTFEDQGLSIRRMNPADRMLEQLIADTAVQCLAATRAAPAGDLNAWHQAVRQARGLVAQAQEAAVMAVEARVQELEAKEADDR